MSISSCLLRNILYDRDNYCCLCFKTIGEMVSFKIDDEVSLDNKKYTTMYEILSSILEQKVLHNIPTQMICQKCTEIAINCYKFIHQCNNNIQQLVSTLDSLQRHTEHINEETYDFKSLFIALDKSNYSVVFYNDNNLNCNSPTQLNKSFQKLKADTQQIFIGIELDSYCSDTSEKSPVTIKNDSKLLQALPQLADVVFANDDPTHFKCKICMKICTTATKLRQHFLRVHAPKKFKCPQCSKSFGSNELLNRHTKDSHCSVVCSQCGKTYTNMYSLRHHEQSHKLRLICQTCGKIYKGRQAFNKHIAMQMCEKMRKSNAEAKLTCDYCNKKYSQKTALSVHIRLEHENGKALVCDWCNKKFSSISRLRDHIVKHTKQKNFECELCGGKFVSKTSLLYHTRTHTGEKPYKCEHCEMNFLSASRRSEHAKRNHAASDLECDICHGKFKGSTCLTRHRRRHFDVKSRLYHKPTATVESIVSSM